MVVCSGDNSRGQIEMIWGGGPPPPPQNHLCMTPTRVPKTVVVVAPLVEDEKQKIRMPATMSGGRDAFEYERFLRHEGHAACILVDASRFLSFAPRIAILLSQ